MRPQRQAVISAAACAALALIAPVARAQYEAPDPAFAAPASYYTTATGTGPTLKVQLNDIIDDHSASSYDDARTRLAVLDRDPNNANNLLLVYSGFSVDATWDSGVTWNREHLWPDSLGIEGNGIDFGDLFNLRPSDPDVNSTRGNKYFDNATGPLPPQIQPKAPEARMTNISWNPRPVERGDIARAMFYMDTRYDGADSGTTDLNLTNQAWTITSTNSNMGILATLLQWHYQDGVTNAERKRNDQIHDLYQGNRNPFVDHPEYVWSVFGGGNNNSRIYVGPTDPSDGASSTSVNLRVIKGGSFGTANVTINKTGSHPTTYDVTTAGSATTPAAGAGQTFDYNPLTHAIQVGLNGSTSNWGTVAGTVTIDNTDITSGGTGQGSTDGNDTINVTGTVLEHAQPSFSAHYDPFGGGTLLVKFAYVPTGGFQRTRPLAVYNVPDFYAGAAFTASLDIDGVTRTGSTLMDVDLTPTDPVNPIAPGASRSFNLTFTSGSTEGLFSTTHTIAVSDESIPGGTALPNLPIDSSGWVTSGNFPVNGDLGLAPGETFTTSGFSIADNVDVFKIGGGTLIADGPQNHGATARLFVSSGPVHFLTDANSTATAGLDVSAKSSSSSVTFQSKQHLRRLQLDEGATGTVALHGDHALVVGSLTVAASSKLNLNDNDLIVRFGQRGSATGGVYGGIQGLVQSGMNDGTWDGSGIVTTTADALSGLTTIGVATGADVLGLGPTDTTVWNGEIVSGSDVLAMYTYAGDANLDGLVSGDDYSSIDFTIQSPGADSYFNGDFNYDGIISGDDYSMIDFNIVAQGAPLGSSGSAALVAGGAVAVPEPAAGALVILTAPFLLARRRRAM